MGKTIVRLGIAALLSLCALAPGITLATGDRVAPKQQREAEVSRFLHGSWRNLDWIPVEGASPETVQIRTTITYSPDNNLRGIGTMRFPPQAGYEHVQRDQYTIESAGWWIVKAQDDGSVRLMGRGRMTTANPGSDFRVDEEWIVNHEIRILGRDTFVDGDSVRWQRVRNP